jgi:hypothetical protein
MAKRKRILFIKPLVKIQCRNEDVTELFSRKTSSYWYNSVEISELPNVENESVAHNVLNAKCTNKKHKLLKKQENLSGNIATTWLVVVPILNYLPK